MVESSAPLAGIRILAVEQFGAGPFGTLLLADLGATVIKIEDPATGGDVSRSIPPVTSEQDSLYFQAFNRGKRSIAIDLQSAVGKTRFHELVLDADAVFNNLRADHATRLGLTYADLGEINPRIVCVSLSGYGRSDERAAEPGYDILVQAETGWAMLTGEPDAPPARSGLPMVDYAAGLTAATALLAGIIDARSTGRGRDLDTSLFDVAVAALSYQAAWWLSAGIANDRQLMSGHPTIIPFQFFRTADGYLAIACAKEKFLGELVQRIGMPELASDNRFVSFVSRMANREQLLDILQARLASESTEHWMTVLHGFVPCAPVQTYTEALAPDRLRERGMLAEFDHPDFGVVRTPGMPIRVSEYTPNYQRAPRLNEEELG